MRALIIGFLLTLVQAAGLQGAGYQTTFSGFPTPGSVAGVDGWVINDTSFTNLSFIANYNGSRGGGLGGFFNSPSLPIVELSHPYSEPLAGTSVAFTFTIIDSQNDFPNRDVFGVSLKNGGVNVFTVYFTPVISAPADPESELNAQWNLSYVAGADPVQSLTEGIFESGTYSFNLVFTGNGANTDFTLTLKSSNTQVRTGSFVSAAANTTGFGVIWKPSAASPSDAGGNNFIIDNLKLIGPIGTQVVPVITWSNPGDIPYGTTLSGTQLNATADVPGSFSYSPPAGTLLNAGNNQLLTANFTPNDLVNYTTASKTVSINVTKVVPSITWFNPADIVYGTALSGAQLNATANVSGSFSYLPGAGTVLNAGNNQLLTVNFSPNDSVNYTTASTIVSINVLKAVPVITWFNPAEIAVGTPLSGAQLNATANVPGSFSYLPVAGTVLGAGNNQLLTVNFAPNDSANFTTASKSVSLNVSATKLVPVITWFNPADINYGTALSGVQLNATADVPGSFSYSPAAGTVLSAGNNQLLTVNFSPNDSVTYTSASKIVSVNVIKAVPVITWSNPADITYGIALSGVQLNATANVPGSFSYLPAAGTVLNAGNNQLLTVNFSPNDSANYTTASKIVSVNVNKAVPVITWFNPADIAFGTPLSGVQLNATADVPGSFSYSPVAGTVLNAGNNQLLTANFTPNDSGNYTTASKSVTLNVSATKLVPVITWFNPADIIYGTALSGVQLNATADVPGSFSYAPVAGTVLNAGNSQLLSVNFSPNDSANYTTASKTVTVNVIKAVPVITWFNPADIAFGTPLSGVQLNATANVPGSFSYLPVAGTVLGAGNNQLLTVNFAPNDSANYTTASKSVSLNVSTTKLVPVITWFNPADITYGTALSGVQLNATADVPGSFSYSPAAGSVLSAGNNQLLTVNFSPNDSVTYTTASKIVSVNVIEAVPVITWSNPADITFGTALSGVQLNATANVPGSFSYAPVAGTVLNAGNSQLLSVNFSPNDSANYTTASKTVTVNVNATKLVPVITWSNPADITYGTALSGVQLNATADVPGSFSYSPAAGTVLSAGNNQLLTVNFSPNDSVTYTTASKIVSVNVIKAVPVITWSNPADITYGTALSGVQLNATANVPGSFSYAPVAGTVLNAGNNQLLSVNFSPNDSANYTTASKTVTVNVTKGAPSITWFNPADITFGTALSGVQLNATANVPGSFSYSPAAGTVLNVGNNQLLTVNFSPNDSANYNTANKIVSVNVTKGVPTITWFNPANITFGTALSGAQLNATANVPGSFSYSPAAGTVLNVGNNQLLTVNFSPNDSANYTTATKIVSVNVTKLVPVITWFNPTDITYGTALSGAQLNATADVPGSFSYSPAAGTVLSSGNGQNLSVTFTPTAAAEYESATATVSINVLKNSLTVRANNASRTYGGINPVFTSTITGFVNGDSVAVVSGAPNLNTSATTTSPVGSVPIVPTLGTLSAANYTFAPFVNGTLTVEPASLLIKANDRTKIYRQALSFTGLEFTAIGLVNGDTVTGASFSSAGATTSATVAGSPYSIIVSSATGSSLGNYTVSYQPGILTVSPVGLLISGLIAHNKVYDSTTSVVLSGTPTLTGVIGADAVSIAGTAQGTFADKHVGNSKPVAVSGLSLSGSDSGNYTLTPLTLTADISPATLTVTGVVVLDKYADGTTDASPNQGGATLQGVLIADVGKVILVTSGATASFADANVGNDKPVTIGGLAIAGSEAGNYKLTQPTTTADIIAKSEFKLLNPHFAAGKFLLSVESILGLKYVVEFRNSLTDPEWTAGDFRIGTGGTIIFTNDVGLVPSRFFRLRAE